MLRNYVRAYEEGRVQRRPCLRFVNGAGRACVVGAMAGAARSREPADTELFRTFRSEPLLRLSRQFESGQLSAEGMYDACLLELTRRSEHREPTPAPAG